MSQAQDLYVLEVDSTTAAVEEAVRDLIEKFLHHIPEAKQNRFKLGLNELVRNAFEHGNLGITSEQKHAVIEQGSFDALVKERSNAAQSAGKKISIESRIHGRRFICRICDQGEGFDWRSMIQFTDVTELHGRGVFIAKRSFDDVVYNEKGNEVTAVMLLIDEADD